MIGYGKRRLNIDKRIQNLKSEQSVYYYKYNILNEKCMKMFAMNQNGRRYTWVISHSYFEGIDQNYESFN